MQSVTAAFTAEEDDPVRNIAHKLQVSWKKDSLLANRTFTIGVSLIGGNDVIGAIPGAIGSPGNYRYFDESTYATSLSWERGLNMPIGGLTKALAEATLDNTSGRFTPRYMGGTSELYTAILPRRPMIINAGFNLDGIDQTIPQFAGLLNKSPKVYRREAYVEVQAADYVDYFQGRKVDQSAIYTGLRTDEILANLFTQQGMSTAQYDLDYGINIPPFAFVEKGDSFSKVVNDLIQAEYGHGYMDETGVFKFRNRQWGDSSPYNAVQRIIYTAQVLSAQAPDDSHIINTVEVNAKVYQKQPLQTVFNLPSLTTITIPANDSSTQFFEFESPILELTDPTSGGTNSYFLANSSPDGTGTDLTSSIQITNIGTFNKSVKYRFTNSSPQIAYITQFVLAARAAVSTTDIYVRNQDDSSVTAYEEQLYPISNPFIQNEDWARTLSQLILADFSQPENLQKITIRAIPELQLFDLISWQGRYWRIFNIAARLDPSVGFIQELTLLQRTVTTYFRIGISTIGGSDRIAP